MPQPLARQQRPVPIGAEEWKRTREAKHRFLERGTFHEADSYGAGVRPEILASWKRSVLSGVDPRANSVPRTREPAENGGILLRAARPVLDQLSEQFRDASTWAMLVDRECRLVAPPIGDPTFVRKSEARGAVPGALFEEERVGTNGSGTAFEVHGPFVVSGAEHFRDSESGITSIGALVRDPLTRRLVGVLGVNCRYEFAHPLLLPFVQELVGAIEERLRLGKSIGERILFDEFLRVSRRTLGPVLALSDTVSMTNAAARDALGAVDHDLLRRQILDAVADGRPSAIDLRLGPDDVVAAVCHPVADGGRHGVVVELSMARTRRPPSTPSRQRPPASTQERLLARIERAERDRLPVLLRGERGCGKSRLAAATGSPSRAGNSTVIDAEESTADPSGWAARLSAALEDPDAIVVLRHLDALDPTLVTSVRRALDTGGAHCRVTASDGILDREDLAPVVDRCSVIVDVPPLRDRVDDIPALVTGIVAELAPGPRPPRLTHDAMAVLLRSTWPGNIRQLRQALATALAALGASAEYGSGPAPAWTAGDITADDLPVGLLDADPRRQLGRLERMERQAIVTALRECGGDKEAAADVLGVSRATIYRKLKKFHIHV